MMGVPGPAGVPATLNLDFDCARRCEADLALEGESVRLTLGQMLQRVRRAHRQAHTAEPPERVFTADGVVVRSKLIPAVAHG